MWKASSYKILRSNRGIDSPHTTSPAEIEALKVRSTICKPAIESRDAPALIIAEATAKLNPAAIAQLPPRDFMKRPIQGERKIKLGAPANPNNTLELEIPDSYKVTKRGELLLLFDSGPSKKLILMFTILILIIELLLYNTALFILSLHITFY